MKKTMRFYLSTIIFLLTAVQAFSQLTGKAVAPVVSTAESPVYYMIESASDGSYTFSGFTGDFRGNVMISPASAGKISYNKPSVAPSPDHTLWQLIDVNGTTLLKNKATGLYMVGSHSVNASGSAFSATVISGMQYKIVTADAGSSYAITWKNNLCDRITVGIQENSLTAWYFTSNETLNDLEIAILANEYVYAKSPAGTNPGTYSNEDRAIYRAVIDAAISLNNDNDATEEEIENAIAALEAAKNTFLASRNEIKLSTENDEVWYYIENAHPTYGVGKVLVNQNNEPETSILFTSKSLDPNKLWKFIDAGNGKVAIQNMASSLYISANPRNQGSSSTAVGFNVTWLGEDAQFLFKADGQDYLHAQEVGSLLVTWGTNTLNSGSAWKLDELPAEDINKPVTIENITLSQGIYTTTGIGNKDHGLAYITISTSGLIGEVSLNSITVDLDGTNNIGAVDNLKLYHTGSTNRLNPAEHQLIAQVNKPATTSTAVEIVLNEPLSLSIGSTIIYIATDVSDNANEGDILDNRVLSAKYDDSEQNNKVYTLTSNTTPLASTVFLKRVVVFKPGDDGAVSYRIPAITTADDGTLITLTDKRKNHSGDLPADIDILAKRSTDNGKTWSEPILVAQGTPNHGYGDAAIIKAKSGKIVALFVGDNGLFQSNPSKLIRTYISTSDDNGLTWSEVRDITSQIYGPECSDPVRNKWDGLFFGSGHALSLRDGRIMAVVAVREPGMSGLQNYAVYSDDEGETWEVSERAIEGGDEAKVVELNDGTILMSSRKIGNRLWAKSTDRGETWGPRNSWTEIWGNNCDADIVRFTSTLDGYDKDRILHTLPNHSSRRNVSMWISYDEATTWPLKKTLCEGTSAYSSITILDDGTIGVYLEEDESKPYKMYFLNFSLEWLTDGADSFTAPGTEIVEAPEFSLEAGRYGENQTLSISSATEGASIYYTVDGSNPNKDALLYDGEITLDKSCTVKAIATKEGMANSVVVSANYIIGYVIPGQGRDVGADRYVTDITTTGGTTNINYTTSTVPDSYYIHHTESNVTVAKGESFKLNLTALPDQGDGLQWCQVIILVDWNGDFDFADSGERIAIIGDAEKDNKATVMNISQEITVPATALEGKRRIRVVYTDAWRPRSADLGEDPVDKGRMYDLDLVVTNNTSISDLSQLNVNIENPVKDKLYFELPTGKYNVNLTDLSGKSLFNTYTTSTVLIPMSNYPSQVYLLNVKDDNGKVYSQKLVKK